jgi:DNA sulfur modification protein DndE
MTTLAALPAMAEVSCAGSNLGKMGSIPGFVCRWKTVSAGHVLGLQHRYEPARLAIAHSLALPDPAPQLAGDDADDAGKVIMGKTLFGDEELPVWVALIVENAGLLHPTVEDFQEQVRRHWHRGILLLQAEWDHCAGENPDGVYERFILFLAQRAGLPAHGETGQRVAGENGEGQFPGGSAGPVNLRLGEPGTDERTGQPANWLLNGKGSPHVALMGGTGSGKTRLARSLLGQIRKQTKVPCIIFDFKGDLASNPAFVSEVGASVVTSPSSPLPLDVLYIPNRSADEITNGAIRFRDSFVLIPKGRIGPVQGGELRDAAKAVFTKQVAGNPIEITTIRDELLALYAANSRKGNTLTETFQELTQWRLFDPRLSPADFFNRSWIIDVHGAQETAQRLIVFLVLDALYAYFKALPDSAMDAQGHRALRLVLVVDEARRVLSYGQPSLMGATAESTSVFPGFLVDSRLFRHFMAWGAAEMSHGAYPSW